MRAAAPEVSLGYLAALGLLFALLALNVVRLRVKHGIPYGDGGLDELRHAVRVHGNFAEWVPLAALVVAGLEMLGAQTSYIHVLMGGLLCARVLHAIGLYSPVGTRIYLVGRTGGALGTWLVLVAACVTTMMVAV